MSSARVSRDATGDVRDAKKYVNSKMRFRMRRGLAAGSGSPRMRAAAMKERTADEKNDVYIYA
jgi:hypothetical protein